MVATMPGVQAADVDPGVVVLGRRPTMARAVESLGGKGAAMAVMIEHGLPVPATAVVTTNAYRRVAEHPAIVELVSQLCETSGGAGVEDHVVDATFTGVGVPDDLRESILRVRREVAPGQPVAVRSSATTEDLGGASFAGQYSSFIGMDGDDEIIDAVVGVWASLWHRAPVLYRRLHGMSGDDVAMAVIVQAMVPAVRSGVVFTIDPGGRADHLRVEHVPGFGEALVSGAVTPSAEVLARADPHDGLVVGDAVRLSLRAEQVFGTPQDVEWADDGTRTWLVQSRPITTTPDVADDDGFDTPVAGDRRLTTAGIGEMLPGVFPVLSWATAGFMVEEAFRQTMSQLGALPSRLVESHGFVVRVRGRAALDLGLVGEVATSLPGGSAEQLEHEYFGVGSTESDVDDADRADGADRIRHDLRVLRAHRFARREQWLTHTAIETLLMSPFELTSMSDRDLLGLRARLVDLGVRAMVAEFATAAAAVAAVRQLEQLLMKHLGPTAAVEWTQRITGRQGVTGVVRAATEVGDRLADVGIEVTAIDEWAAVDEALVDAGMASVGWEVAAAMWRAGSQRVVGGTTWDETPDRFWHLVGDVRRRGAPSPVGDVLTSLEHELVHLPGWRRLRILTGQVVDVRRLLVRRSALDAIDLLGRRELAKADVLALGGLIRRLDLEAGDRLVRRGVLTHRLDVVHLHPIELADVLIGAGSISLDVVLRRRRCVERWEADDELPLAFTGWPAPTANAPIVGDRFDGWPASPGRHTGPVRVLHEPDETLVSPGDVVVARRTDASWAPVFLRAAAVVVEEGGPLSHAAVVAREFGLPAVVNVPGVVARLRHEVGPVTVDGDVGAVFVGAAEGDGEGSDRSNSEVRS